MNEQNIQDLITTYQNLYKLININHMELEYNKKEKIFTDKYNKYTQFTLTELIKEIKFLTYRVIDRKLYTV